MTRSAGSWRLTAISSSWIEQTHWTVQPRPMSSGRSREDRSNVSSKMSDFMLSQASLREFRRLASHEGRDAQMTDHGSIDDTGSGLPVKAAPIFRGFERVESSGLRPWRPWIRPALSRFCREREISITSVLLQGLNAPTRRDCCPDHADVAASDAPGTRLGKQILRRVLFTGCPVHACNGSSSEKHILTSE